MPSLKNPNRQIPGGGYDFRQTEINWSARKSLGLHPSIDTVARALISARKAHPHLVAKHKWATDFNSVRNEVIAFNVKTCMAMGWTDFITDAGGGGAVPLAQPRSPEAQKLLDVAAVKARKLWSGVKTLNDWLDSGEPPVPKEQATARALVCLSCDLNGKGDLTSFFTTTAAAAIKRQLSRMLDQKISNEHDANLGVCRACLCPMKLKIQTPVKFIKPHLAADVLDEMRAGNPNCWVAAEVTA